ncbi:MAG: hypothetical protein ABI354_00745 [Candidatus Saccharimonadales bacterium]
MTKNYDITPTLSPDWDATPRTSVLSGLIEIQPMPRVTTVPEGHVVNQGDFPMPGDDAYKPEF